MRRLAVLLVLAAASTLGAHADEAKIVLASVQPFEECVGLTYSPELRSGCFVVPPAKERFVGTPEHPAIIGWKLPPKAEQDKVFPPLPASLAVKPVYKKQVRRVVAKQCLNCKYISAQTAQGKQLARMFARSMGVQASSIAGFFVPWPFSIAVNTVTCAAVSVGFDAKEYREDWNEEPTQEQYQKSFGNNLLYCSPIGGFISARNPLEFLMAGLGFSSYFVNLPTAVGYTQQAYPWVQYAVTNQKTAVVQKHTSVRSVKAGRAAKTVAEVQQ